MQGAATLETAPSLPDLRHPLPARLSPACRPLVRLSVASAATHVPASRLPLARLAAAVMAGAFLIGGCSTPPRNGSNGSATATGEGSTTGGARDDSDAPDGEKRRSGKANYRFDIEAPRALADQIREQTLVGRWQNREDYDPIQFGGLVARLREEVQAILQADGYFQAEIRVDEKPDEVGVAVKPGPQAKVGDTTIRITGPAAADRKIGPPPTVIPDLGRGEPFRGAAWQAGKRQIIDNLNRQGYLRAEVASSEARVDVAQGSVSLDLVVASGPQLGFGELAVEGLQRYKRKIIDDLRPFKTGEPYSDAQLQAFLLRLRSAGYFSSVSAVPDLLALQQDPKAERVRIQVVVSELERRRVVLGVGYSTDEGPRGQLGFEHRDLFGANLQLESALVLSAKQQRAFANFRTPYDANNRFIGFGQRIEREDIENLVTLRSNTYAGVGKREGAIESFTSLQYQIEQERIAAGADGRRSAIRSARSCSESPGTCGASTRRSRRAKAMRSAPRSRAHARES